MDKFEARKNASTENIETWRKEKLGDLAKSNGITLGELNTVQRERTEEQRFGTMKGTLKGMEVQAMGQRGTINGQGLLPHDSKAIFDKLQRIMRDRDEINGKSIELTHNEIEKEEILAGDENEETPNSAEVPDFAADETAAENPTEYDKNVKPLVRQILGE